MDKSEQSRTLSNLIWGLNMRSTQVGKKKTSFFKDVKLKVLSKISNWQDKIFLSGGKKIHIKAIAQVIRPYDISVFKLLKDLYEDMQRAIANFWQGSKEGKHRIHRTR